MRTLVLALAVLLPLAASAQPSFGVKAGLNVSNVYGADVAGLEEAGLSKSAALGFVGGLAVDVPLSSAFGVRLEGLYAQKGFQSSGTILSNDIEAEIDLSVDYVEVPVLARVAVPVGELADAGVLIGVAPAFEVRERADVEVTLFGEPVPGFEDAVIGDDAFKPFDLGAVFGAEFGSGPFAVELRYTYGLLDVNRSRDDDPTLPALRNGAFSVTGAFRVGR